jgi:hypothetical protein
MGHSEAGGGVGATADEMRAVAGPGVPAKAFGRSYGGAIQECPISDEMDKVKDMRVPAETDPEIVVDTCHSMGRYGPAYQVTRVLSNELVEIQLLESGEVTEYPLSSVLLDPVAA